MPPVVVPIPGMGFMDGADTARPGRGASFSLEKPGPRPFCFEAPRGLWGDGGRY